MEEKVYARILDYFKDNNRGEYSICYEPWSVSFRVWRSLAIGFPDILEIESTS